MRGSGCEGERERYIEGERKISSRRETCRGRECDTYREIMTQREREMYIEGERKIKKRTSVVRFHGWSTFMNQRVGHVHVLSHFFYLSVGVFFSDFSYFCVI